MLRTHAQTLQGYAVMRLSGVLHAATYRQARDAVIKAALDQTNAVIVDGRVPHSLLLELFTNEGQGTMIVPDSASS